MKLGVVGLGKVGLPLALVLAAAGHYVTGYDVAPDRVKARLALPVDDGEEGLGELIRFQPFRLADSLGELADLDAVLVIVQTPHNPEYGGHQPMPAETRDFNYDYLAAALASLDTAAGAAGRVLPVIVVSTVLPGTTTRLAAAVPNLRLVYSPVFISLGTVIPDLQHPDFVLAGATGDTADLVEAVWREVHDRPVYRCSVESAELLKVSMNCFMSMKIMFANALMELSEATGADVDEVTDGLALSSKVTTSAYLHAGLGDGGPCFPPGEIVITEAGPRPIETVKRGDRVLTLDGTLQPVMNVMIRDYAGTLVALKSEGLPVTRMTDRHPVMACRDLRTKMRNGRKPTKIFPRSEVRQIPARDLTTDDLVIFPRSADEPVELPEHATAEYLELAGWWLSEGNIYFNKSKHSGRVSWALHLDEVAEGDRIAELVSICLPPRDSERGGNSKISIEINPAHKQRRVRVGSIKLAEQLEADFGRFGHLQHERSLPPWALWSDQKTAALLLEGLLKGDGCITERGVTFSTVSEQLAWGVFVLLTQLGFKPMMQDHPPYVGKSDGVYHRRSWVVRIRNKAQARRLFPLLNISQLVHMGPKERRRNDPWRPVRTVAPQPYQGKVYNLHVSGTNTYVTSAGAVHNCRPRDAIAMSWLGERHGLSFDPFRWLVQAREAQSSWLAGYVKSVAEAYRLPVFLLGRTYKPGLRLTDGSAADLLNCELHAPTWDPMLDGVPPGWDRPHVFVVGTQHPEFTKLALPAGSVVIDPFGYLRPQPDVTYFPVGRSSDPTPPLTDSQIAVM